MLVFRRIMDADAATAPLVAVEAPAVPRLGPAEVPMPSGAPAVGPATGMAAE
jgi:hypothetical protein